MAPSTYSFYRCYMQRGNKKFVRLYSDQYKLMANAIEGTCTLDGALGFYACGGPDGCKPDCQGQDEDLSPRAPPPPGAANVYTGWYAREPNRRVAGQYDMHDAYFG